MRLDDLRWRVGLLVFGTLLLVGAACAFWTLQELRASSARAASQDARAIARSVAQTLAGQFGRAVRLGIPLAELPGVAPHLKAVLGRQPVLSSIAVLGPDGNALHRAGRADAPADGQVRVAIAGSGAPAGFVTASAERGASLRGSLGWAMAASLLAVPGLSLLAALVAALWPGARLEAQRRQLLQRLQHAGADALPPEGDAGSDGLQAALHALAQGDAEQRRAREALQAYAHELLAVDFDGQLRAPVERSLRQATPAAEGDWA